MSSTSGKKPLVYLELYVHCTYHEYRKLQSSTSASCKPQQQPTKNPSSATTYCRQEAAWHVTSPVGLYPALFLEAQEQDTIRSRFVVTLWLITPRQLLGDLKLQNISAMQKRVSTVPQAFLSLEFQCRDDIAELI